MATVHARRLHLLALVFCPAEREHRGGSAVRHRPDPSLGEFQQGGRLPVGGPRWVVTGPKILSGAVCGMVERSVGVGFTAESVVLPGQWSRSVEVSAGVGKCCQSAYPVQEQVQVWCAGGEFEATSGMAG